MIAGLIGAATFTFIWWSLTSLAKVFLPPMSPIDWLIGAAPGPLVFGNVVVARKWPLVGGVLLILEGSLLLVPLVIGFQLSASLPLLLSYGVVALPLLASGVLFLLSWREWRKSPKISDS